MTSAMVPKIILILLALAGGAMPAAAADHT